MQITQFSRSDEMVYIGDCGAIVAIEKDKILSAIKEGADRAKNTSITSKMLARIGAAFSSSGDNDIRLDLADLSLIVGHNGVIMVGIGEAKGEDAACLAVRNILSSRLFESMSSKAVSAILVHFSTHPEHPLSKIQQAMQTIYDLTDENGDVIFGSTTSLDMGVDEVATVIMVGSFRSKFQVVLSVIKNTIRQLMSSCAAKITHIYTGETK